MIKKLKLDNGLELILNQDKSKHRAIADLYIKVGGVNNKFYYGDKYYVQPYGVAHFLEHYLLEQSMYGNIMNYFGKEYINSNGLTSLHRTNYYISTVHDFKDNLLKLLNVINNPVFSEDKINETKIPISAEINRKKDSKYNKLYEKVFDSIFENKLFNINLGSIEDINNMTIDDIKLFYDTFYQPSNQILVLTGNFDDDIIDTVKDVYNNLNKEYKSFKKVEIIEPKEVVEKDKVVNSIVNNDLFVLSFKIDVTKLTPLEKNKFDYYIGYIYESNFGTKSYLSHYLFKNNLTNFKIEFKYDADYTKDYIIISLEVVTNKIDEVLKLMFQTFNNLDLNEDHFNKWINNRIINMINRYENIGNITKSYLDNMFLYDLEEYDDIDFLKSLNLIELKDMMNKLNLSNYSVVRHINKSIDI